jgi:hypothetical protein
MMLDAPLATAPSTNDSPAPPFIPPFIPPSSITLQSLFTMMVVPIVSSSMTLLYLELSTCLYRSSSTRRIIRCSRWFWRHRHSPTSLPTSHRPLAFILFTHRTPTHVYPTCIETLLVTSIRHHRTHESSQHYSPLHSCSPFFFPSLPQ